MDLANGNFGLTPGFDGNLEKALAFIKVCSELVAHVMCSLYPLEYQQVVVSHGGVWESASYVSLNKSVLEAVLELFPMKFESILFNQY